jgi:hypothetical protein
MSYVAIILGAVFGLFVWSMLCFTAYVVVGLARYFTDSRTIAQFLSLTYSTVSYFWTSTVMTAVVIYRMKEKL